MVDDKKGGDTQIFSSSSTQNPVYALSHQDVTGAKITHVILVGPNYEEWAKGFQVALGAKRKLGFIDGTLKEPSDSIELEEWKAVNYLIVAWIFNTIESRVRSSISYRVTAHELWEDIRLRFTVANDIKIYQIQCDLSECKQRPGETIMDYYGRIKKLWDDMNDFDPVPVCQCSACPARLRKRREADQARGFLMGLDSGYAGVRSQLLGTKPFPQIELVYSRLVQEEEVRNLTRAREENAAAMALAVRDGNNGKSPQQSNSGRPRFTCTYCGRDGHTESRCYKKHGYPNDRGPARTRSGDGSASSASAKTNSVTGEPSVATNMVRLSGPCIDDDWCG